MGEPTTASGRARWKRPLPLIVPAATAVVAAVAIVVMALAISGKDDDIAALEAANASITSEYDDALARRDDIENELDDALDDIDAEQQRADEAEEAALAAAEEALAERITEVVAREADAQRREDEVAGRERQLDATLNGLRSSQFGDGVHEVGRDIQPGRYHTEGSGRTCYYAKLGPDGQDILDNNNVDGPVTIIIDSAFFESARCGTWTKVG